MGEARFGLKGNWQKKGEGSLGLHVEGMRGLAWCGEGRRARRAPVPGFGCGVKDWSLEEG